MPYMDKGRRAGGPQAPRGERAPLSDLQVRNQSRYGTATTDPLGRDGRGWTKSVQTGLPALRKGWKRDPRKGRAVKETPKGDHA